MFSSEKNVGNKDTFEVTSLSARWWGGNGLGGVADLKVSKKEQ